MYFLVMLSVKWNKWVSFGRSTNSSYPYLQIFCSLDELLRVWSVSSSKTDMPSLLERVPVKLLLCCLLPGDGGDAAVSSGESLLLDSEPEIRHCCETKQSVGEDSLQTSG